MGKFATKVHDYLFIVSIKVVDHDQCKEQYKHLTSLQPTQFCAGVDSITDIRDACAGDSGGPFAVLDNGRWFLTGVVSFGMGCGRYIGGILIEFMTFIAAIELIATSRMYKTL